MGVVCGFCGHSDAPESLRIELKETIADLIREKNVHLFYVGNHGGFDRMVLGVLQELQASFPVMRYYVVLAYHPQLSAPVSHDAPTIFPEDLETVPKRAAIRWLRKPLAPLWKMSGSGSLREVLNSEHHQWPAKRDKHGF